jgi:hypothetical protein
MRVGSPDGLNPFGATVGPGGHAQPPGQQAPPAWQQDVGLAATSPPTHDDAPAHAAPAHGAHAHAHAPAHAPPAHAGHAPAHAHAHPPTPPPQVHPEPHTHGARDPEHLDANAPRALAGFLVSYEGNELGVFFPIHQGQNVVGRKGAAAGLNIEIDHGTTSSRHATLFASARPGRIKVEDVGSTNGTFVGEQMLERNKKHELKDGDVVRFGGYVTIVKII